MRQTLAELYRRARGGVVEPPVDRDRVLEDAAFISSKPYERFVSYLRDEINRSQVQPGDVTSVNYQIGYLAGVTKILNHLAKLEESTRGVNDE